MREDKSNLDAGLRTKLGSCQLKFVSEPLPDFARRGGCFNINESEAVCL